MRSIERLRPLGVFIPLSHLDLLTNRVGTKTRLGILGGGVSSAGVRFITSQIESCHNSTSLMGFCSLGAGLNLPIRTGFCGFLQMQTRNFITTAV